MSKDMLLHQQVQQQQEENMSNLTSSGDQASVSSGNRTEASGSNFFHQQEQQQFFVPEPQPQKKKRSQPGNPGPCGKNGYKEKKYTSFSWFWTDSLFQLFDTVIFLENYVSSTKKNILFTTFILNNNKK